MTKADANSKIAVV